MDQLLQLPCLAGMHLAIQPFQSPGNELSRERVRNLWKFRNFAALLLFITLILVHCTALQQCIQEARQIEYFGWDGGVKAQQQVFSDVRNFA
ncbi:hypothetical protein D9M70_612940 [compost metagenome]